MNNLGGEGVPLWNDADEFFYDALHLPDGRILPMRLRSFVRGMMPVAPSTTQMVMPRFPAVL